GPDRTLFRSGRSTFRSTAWWRGRLLEGDLVLRAVHAYAGQNTVRSAGRSLRHQSQHQAVCEENGVPTGERHQGDRSARDFRSGETFLQRGAGRDACEHGNALLRMYPGPASRAFGGRSAGQRSQSSGDETQRDRQALIGRSPVFIFASHSRRQLQLARRRGTFFDSGASGMSFSRTERSLPNPGDCTAPPVANVTQSKGAAYGGTIHTGSGRPWRRRASSAVPTSHAVRLYP